MIATPNPGRWFTDSRGLHIAALVLAGCMPRDAGFHDVRQLVRERAGAEVRWRPGEAERGTIEMEVHQLLAQPLTAITAVRIALLNNRELQASFEDLGVSQGVLLGASLLPNPRVSGD